MKMSLSEACQTASHAKGDPVAKLQQQIEYHLGIVYDLRHQINQHAAISKLPPEILCRVFHFAQDACELIFWEPYVGVNWTVVTRICRHWRDVALKEPSLWARLPLRMPKWTTMMLQRSREASLSVTIDVSTIRSSVISEVFGQAHRLTQLTIEKSLLAGPPLEKLFVDWGSLHVPNLEKLCLHRPGFQSEKPLLPETLLQGTAKLRHLELSGVDISWDSHLLKSLTTLVIGHISTSRMPNWLQLRSMLQGMPELHSLTMRQTLPSTTPDTTFISSPIHLPSLKMFSLADDATSCELFLRSILFSDGLEMSKCNICVEAQHTATNICDLLSLASRMSSGACLSARARSLLIEGALGDSKHLNMAVKTANDLLDLEIDADTRWVEINELPGLKFDIRESIMSPPTGGICSELFTGIFRAFHFQDLCELDLSGLEIPSSELPIFSDTLAATYGTLPKLCNVIVGSATASSLIDILSIGSDEQGDYDTADEHYDSDVSSCDGSDDTDVSDEEIDLGPIRSSSPIVFPALRNLKLFDVSFHGNGNNLFVVNMDRLEKCFINRSRRGVGILVLVIESCSDLLSKDVEQLNDLVPVVEWYEDNAESEED